MKQKRYTAELLRGEFPTFSDTAWSEEATAQAFNDMNNQTTDELMAFDTYEEAKAYLGVLVPQGVIMRGDTDTGFLYSAQQVRLMCYTKDEGEDWDDARIECLDMKTSAYCEEPALVRNSQVRNWLYLLELEVKDAIRYFETFKQDEQADKMRELLKKLEPYEDSDDMFVITEDGELKKQKLNGLKGE